MSREKQTLGVESITGLPCWQGAKQCWCEIECEDCIESNLLAAGYRKQSEVIKEFVIRFERYIGNCTFTMGQTNDIQYALKKAREEMIGE